MISELSGHGSYALKAARGVDVAAGKMVEDAVVLVENERITGFGKGLSAPAGASVIDLGDATLMPGLHDNHCHLLTEPIDLITVVYRWGSAAKALHGLRNAQKTLWGGFTTVRVPGDADWQNASVELRDFIARGHAPGPRMLVAPHYLSITGGHGDANGFACDLCIQSMGKIVDGVVEMRKAVREEIKLGADWIKIFASGGVLSMGDDPTHSHYTLEEIRVAAEEAHRLGRRITAHAHGAQAVKYCAEAGFDSVEHCSFIDDEGIEMMKAKGVPCVPTLYVLDYIQIPENPMNLDASIIRKAAETRKFQRDRFARIVKAGAPVVYGTDIGVFPHGENWRDFPVMVQCGMAPMEAIRSATVNSARMNGIADQVGVLEEGKRADVIAVAGDPLADVGRMADVRFVMRDGVVYRNDREA